MGYVHTTIRKALAQAEAWDLVRKNVARFAKPPKEDHSEPDAMTVEEAQAFLRAIAGDRLEALYLLAVTTGLRRGELLGLKWADLNLDRGYLRVERSLDTLYGPPAENDPKRASSRRPAVLLPPVVASLKAHRTRQAAEKLAAGLPGANTATSSPRASAPRSGATTSSRGPSSRSRPRSGTPPSTSGS